MSDFFEHTTASVDALIPYALNAKEHPDRQIAMLAANIREFGFTNPVLVDEDNNLIAGHGRVLAARKLGMEQLPAIVVTGLDERKRRALIIADNKLSETSWDQELLLEELSDLSADFGELMGFTNDELAALLGEGKEAPDEVEDGADYTENFAVVVVCADEASQTEIYDRLTGEGLECKVLVN